MPATSHTAQLSELDVVLGAPDVATWLSTHLRARFTARAGEEEVDGPVAVVSVADLVADDAALLRAIHATLVADGTPAPAASTYLAGWFAGMVAGAVGYGLATAGAGLLAGGPASTGSLRFHLHPEGWPLRVDLPVRAVMTCRHPWSAHDHSEVVDTADEVVARSVRALVGAVRPIVDACHRTSRVGATGLWNEVGDALGRTLASQQLVRPTPRMVAVLEAAVSVPDVPWRARPCLGFAESPVLGPVHVAQKGGCCLAYTVERDHVPTADDPDLDPDRQAYLRRFPIDPDQPAYCLTCSLRDPDDSTARQLFWVERRAGAT